MPSDVGKLVFVPEDGNDGRFSQGLPPSYTTCLDSNFYKETFNEYLNFHRPCGFATETVDDKGKIKKEYNDYLTPFEKLQTLAKPEQFLKKGVTMESLKEVELSRVG